MNHLIIHENAKATREKVVGLGKQESVKLVHEAVIERGEILETLGAGFFETFEEEDLCARV
jgi:hypothetical protein